MPPKKKMKVGNYHCRKTDTTTIDFKDFSNPWNFFALFQSSDTIIHSWLKNRGLLLTTYTCSTDKCGRLCKWVYRRSKDTITLRCEGNSDHEFSIRKNSFFEKSHYSFQDLMNFVKLYLEGQLLVSISEQTGMCYKSTALHWSQLIRKMFKQYIYDCVHGKNDLIFSGIQEIDESIFGRRVKYNRGNPRVGIRVSIYM